MKMMDDNGQRFLFVMGNDNFLGLITEGDLRRQILSGMTLDNLIVYKADPVTVAPGEEKKAKKLLGEYEVIPVIEKGKLVDYYTQDSFNLQCPVVIMAGGKGSRLKPFTDVLPKPLIPVGGKTIIEHITERFEQAGTQRIIITTNYKAGVIRAFLHDRDYEFVEEPEPLGTAGGLKLIDVHDDFIVTNCDIMVDCDYAQLVDHHRMNGYAITVVGATVTNIIPYGSCILEDGILRCIEEKPQLDYIANTGLYVVSPEVLELIPDGPYDFTEFITTVQKAGWVVGVFPVSAQKWRDIGQWREYKQVLDQIEQP